MQAALMSRVENPHGQTFRWQYNQQLFLGPYSKIVSGEQFIPIFACLPAMRPRVIHGNNDRWFSEFNNLAGAHLLLSSLISPELTNKLNPMVIIRLSLHLWEEWNSNKWGYNIPTTLFLYNSLQGIATRKSLFIQKVMTGNINKSATLEFLDSFLNNTDYWRGFIKSALIQVLTDAAKPLNDEFGLYFSDTHGTSAVSGTNELVGLSRSTRSSMTVKVSSNTGSVINVIIRNLYAGIMNKGGLNASLAPASGQFLRSSFGRPDTSVMYGVKSLFSFVIKAKHRDYLAAMLITNMENKITLPKGDMQLWIDTELATLLGGNIPSSYTILIEECKTTGVEVKQVENLTKVLFNQSDPPEMTSAEDYEEQIRKTIAKARLVAKAEGEDKQAMDRLYNL